MNARIKWCASMLGAAMCVGAGVWPARAQAQEVQHVVTLDELNRQKAQPAETRQANEEAVHHLLSSDAGREALKSVHADYQRVDKAIGQLSDEELVKLAERSRHAENDFAAGLISAKTLAYLILATVVIVVIVVLVNKV